MNSDFVLGMNKAIDAASGVTGREYPEYLHNTVVTEKLDELTEAIAEGGGGGGSSTLAGLTDVDISGTVQGGKCLKYNSTTSKWEPGDDSGNVQSDWNENDSTSGAYILNKPTIPAAQVNADWNSDSGVSQILNKPTIQSWTDVTGTLTAGETSITLSSAAITANSTIDIYTNPELNHTAISSTVGSVTVTFEAQSSDVSVKARIS